MNFKFALPIVASIIFASTSVLATTSNADANGKQKDGQIIQVLITLNKGEIASANQVLKQKLDPKVKQYALLMKKEHSKNLSDTMQVSHSQHIKALPSDTATSLKSGSEKEIAELKPLKNPELQKTYIEDMVTDHTNALDMLDNDALKNVTNPQLKKLLEATRAHVQNHLDLAKEVEGDLS